MSADGENKTGPALPEEISSAHRFRHEAMATAFEVYVVHDDPDYAEQAGQAAFRELDRLEQELSRFVENSDVARINDLQANTPLAVGPEVFECLSICAEMYKATFGALDITVGSLYDCWFGPDRKTLKPAEKKLEQAKKRTGMQLIKLNADELTVEVSVEGLQVDLGAIGKGYAIDKMSEVLKEWSIKKAFINSGSTIYAMDKCAGTKGWPVTLSLPPGASGKISPPQVLKKLELENIALSGSNQEYGTHIIDSRSARPVEAKLAAWGMAKSAPRSDGLSTALMVMSDEEAKKYFAKHKEDAGMVVLGADGKKTIEERTFKYGAWKVF